MDLLLTALDDVTVGRMFVVATLPGHLDRGIDRFYFVPYGQGIVTMESLNFPTKTLSVDAGQVRSQMTKLFWPKLASNVGADWLALVQYDRGKPDTDTYFLTDITATHELIYPLDRMTAISQTIFSDAFSLIIFFIFWQKFHCNFFLRFQLTITKYCFR